MKVHAAHRALVLLVPVQQHADAVVPQLQWGAGRRAGVGARLGARSRAGADASRRRTCRQPLCKAAKIHGRRG